MGDKTRKQGDIIISASVGQGSPILTPALRQFTLEELVRDITLKNRHEESGFGPPVGREIVGVVTMPRKDPIVEEIHAVREEIARQADYDLERMLEAARARQKAGSLQAVRLPPRKTEPAKTAS